MIINSPDILGNSSVIWCVLSGIFLLYAEIHYRMGGGPSWIYRRHPEILADVPHRINPSSTLPVLLFIKDAHTFPIFLESVHLTIRQNYENLSHNQYSLNESIDRFWWSKLIYCELPKTAFGTLWVDVQFSYKIRGKRFVVTNDNFPGLSHRDFKVFHASDGLPLSNEVLYGDLHYHSQYTSDQIEFGAPIEASANVAKSIGLDFLAISDHSYDLDTEPEHYERLDSSIAKWHRSREEIADLNRAGGNYKSILLPAEEVTVQNHASGNVHMLVINHPDFIPGSGDSGRKIRGKSEYTIPEVLNLLGEHSLGIAGHPHTPAPTLQRWLIRRDSWKSEDTEQTQLDGLQFLNGVMNADFFAGKKQWIQQLLMGDRKFIYAGNDAHGNFNRYRQIYMPMISLREKEDQILGKCRTGLLLQSDATPDIETISDALKQGCCFITNGPALVLRVGHHGENSWQMGDVAPNGKYTITAYALSTEEFGYLDTLKLYRGIVGESREQLILTKSYQQLMEVTEKQLHTPIPQNCYYRAEVSTKQGIIDLTTSALTNPIWIQSS